jgi:uracil-DNA glycosylase
MILGRDFDTKDNHCEAVKAGEEVLTGTWTNLLELLSKAGIDPTECFYTNAYMGLRDESSTTNTGKAKGHTQAFTHACRGFLLRQIGLVRPRLILCLGPAVARFVAGAAPLPTSWSKGTLKGIDDEKDKAIVRDVRIDCATPVDATFAVLIHPSMRWANVKRRMYGGLTGKDAELLLLRDAYAAAFGDTAVRG